MQQYQSAADNFEITCFKKRESYENLGWMLYRMQQHQSAFNAFQQSLALEGTTGSYVGLANVLYGQGNKEQGIKLMRKVCKNLNVHLNIDPFLGEQGGVKVKCDLIDHITEKFSGIEYAFHPSYLSEAGESNYFESWKHLIHIHIEKCAGTNFIQPLVELANLLNYEKNNNKRINVANFKRKHYLCHGNLGGLSAHAFMLEAFQGEKNK